MGSQGKQLTAEVEELVVAIKKHHDKELKSGKFVSTKNPAGRTAACLGIGVATVKRIMARYAQSTFQATLLLTYSPIRSYLNSLLPLSPSSLPSQNILNLISDVAE